MKIYVKGGAWTNAEDQVLQLGVMKYGLYSWDRVATMLPRKNASLAQARWNEWLNPTIEKGPWTHEEDVRLLELCQMWPNQWRTISDQFGASRTAGQCVHRFNELQSADGGAASGAGGALVKQSNTSAGGGAEEDVGETAIDTNHMLEGRAAVGDAANLDSFERQMFDDARGRVANTSGKKGLRKERDEQLRESRLLTQLQKRREMREAGIEGLGEDPLKNYYNKVKVERRRVEHEEAAEEERADRMMRGEWSEGDDDQNTPSAFIPVSVADLQQQSRGKRPRSPGSSGRTGADTATTVVLGAFPDSLLLQPKVLMAPFLVAPKSFSSTSGSAPVSATHVDPAVVAAAAGRLPVQTQRALLAELNGLALIGGPEDPSKKVSGGGKAAAEAHAANVLSQLKSTRVSQASKRQAQEQRSQSDIGWMKTFGTQQQQTVTGPFGRVGVNAANQQQGTAARIGAAVLSALRRKDSASSSSLDLLRIDNVSTSALLLQLSQQLPPPSGMTPQEFRQVNAMIQQEATTPTYFPELQPSSTTPTLPSERGLKKLVSDAILSESSGDSQLLYGRVQASLHARNPVFCCAATTTVPPSAVPTAAKMGSSKKKGTLPGAAGPNPRAALQRIQEEVSAKVLVINGKADRRLAQENSEQKQGNTVGTDNTSVRLQAGELGLFVYEAAYKREIGEIQQRRAEGAVKLQVANKRRN